jgi:hypothetical protein
VINKENKRRYCEHHPRAPLNSLEVSSLRFSPLQLYGTSRWKSNSWFFWGKCRQWWCCVLVLRITMDIHLRLDNNLSTGSPLTTCLMGAHKLLTNECLCPQRPLRSLIASTDQNVELARPWSPFLDLFIFCCCSSILWGFSPQGALVGVNRISDVPHIDYVNHDRPMSILTQSLIQLPMEWRQSIHHIGWPQYWSVNIATFPCVGD